MRTLVEPRLTYGGDGGGGPFAVPRKKSESCPHWNNPIILHETTSKEIPKIHKFHNNNTYGVTLKVKEGCLLVKIIAK
jgi:hypothetical protein